jgi:predicted metalloprotease with PDZ domain
MASKAWLGAMFVDAGAGPEVAEVEPGGFAEQAGMQPGDILLMLGRGAVFGNREVMFFLREHDVGDEVDVIWAHGGELRRGRGRLTHVTS